MHANTASLKKCIALVGAPNSGKTTLYNWLTASKFKTVNYPGATVEYSIGKIADRYASNAKNQDLFLMDTPGTYSLFPKSADEEVTVNAIYNHPEWKTINTIILVVDATQMERHLILAELLKEAKFNFVIALTMADLIEKNKIKINLSHLESRYGTKVVPIDGLLGGGVASLVEAAEQYDKPSAPVKLQPWTEKKMIDHQKQIEAIVHQAEGVGGREQMTRIYDQTAKIDRWLLHPVFGLLVFFLMMWGLFTLIYSGAAPLMDLVDSGFGYIKDKVIEINPDNLGVDFLANGVVASFAAVFIFVPQILILFLGIGLLEASGYLARAATLIDKPFSKIGLSGRSFVPLLSGFACAVPAIIATRNISSSKDRWITNFVIPLMSCSARLPVYALLLGFLFIDEPSWKAGMALAALYIAAMVVGGISAGILNKIIKFNDKAFFMMELPLYRKPKIAVIFKQAMSRTGSYIKRAGPPIFIFAVLIWVGSTFPNYKMQDPERLQTSYLAQAGSYVEPVFKPMGVDWRVGVGLISAFAAREVFVSSMAMMFNVTAEDEDALNDSMLAAMADAKFADGTAIFTVASVVGLLAFFMIALQCMSTVGVQLRENKSWKFAVNQLIIFNVVAYLIAVILYQGLRSIGLG